jgi:hypothetical protein
VDARFVIVIEHDAAALFFVPSFTLSCWKKHTEIDDYWYKEIIIVHDDDEEEETKESQCQVDSIIIIVIVIIISVDKKSE